jgi:hypothetical protein
MLNFTTGTVGGHYPIPAFIKNLASSMNPKVGMAIAANGGPLGPTRGPLACIEAGKPEIAAMNAGDVQLLLASLAGLYFLAPSFPRPTF